MAGCRRNAPSYIGNLAPTSAKAMVSPCTSAPGGRHQRMTAPRELGEHHSIGARDRGDPTSALRCPVVGILAGRFLVAPLSQTNNSASRASSFSESHGPLSPK